MPALPSSHAQNIKQCQPLNILVKISMISNAIEFEFDELDFELDDLNFEINDPTIPFLNLLEEAEVQNILPKAISPGLLPRRVIHMLILLKDHQERTISLDNPTYLIGREPDNSIVLDDKTVSRHHAMLLRIPDPTNGVHSFRITDGNMQGQRSHNGIYVNGRRCFSHDLEDQDVITFGSNIQAVYRQFELYPRNSSQPAQRANPLAPQSTEVLGEETQTEVLYLSKAALARLTSFPEMDSNPIIEMDFNGHITYLNSAASSQFPAITENKQHPFKEGITEILSSDAQQSYTREVTVDDRVYEQTMYRVPENQLIRCYLIDVTRRQQMA